MPGHKIPKSMIRTIRDPHLPFASPAAFRFFSLLLAAGLLLAAEPRAFAAARTWQNTNAGTATWNRSGNWNPQAIPGSGDTAVINNTFTALVPTGVTGNYTILNIGTTSGGTGNLNITGGTLNAVNISPQTNIGQAAGGQGNVTMTAGTWSGGTISVGFSGTGTLDLSGGALNSLGGTGLGINTGSAGTATVSGGIWTSNNDLGVGGSGTGTLNLTGGGITLSTGKILIASVAGSTGTLNIGTGTTAGTANTTTVKGGSGNATVNFNQSGNYTFAPALTGNMQVNVIGNGTTILTADSNYAGNTTITNGMLLVMGDESAVTGTTTVQGGAKLGGTGTIGGDVVMEAASTLSPGQSGAGLLTITHAITMQASSTLEMQLTGTGAGQYDHLYAGGNFTGGGTLDLNVSYAATAGDTFLLFTSGGFDSGSFTITTNLAGGLTWDDSQLASTGVISIVPEPSTFALSGLVLIAIAMFAQRYRRPGLRGPEARFSALPADS